MPMVITIMKTSLMTTFKMEVGNPYSQYKWKQTTRKIENLKWSSRVRNMEIVDLPPPWFVDKSMATIYPHTNIPQGTSKHLHQSQNTGNLWNFKVFKHRDFKNFFILKGRHACKNLPFRCKLCGEIGHQVIGFHYHPLIIDDKGVFMWPLYVSDLKDMEVGPAKVFFFFF
jgi:hypothetical protein